MKYDSFTMQLKQIITRYSGEWLLALCIIIALLTFKNYGISWDEVFQHRTGNVNYNYVFSGDPYLLEYPDRDYGAAFELSLIIIEKIMGLEEHREIFLMRHLVTHLFFLFGAYAGYHLVYLLYRRKLLAVAVFLLIVLFPRIYAHSFFNTKDIPFLAMFIICLYATVRAFQYKTIYNYVILGACVGILLNLRVMGLLVFAGVPLMLILDMFFEKKLVANIKFLGSFLISAFFLLYISWPYLWDDPVCNYITAVQNMAHFRWDGKLLLNGETILASNLPWYYAPLWFLHSTPVIYLLGGFAGAGLMLWQFFTKPVQCLSNGLLRNHMFFLVCFLAPFIVVILFESVLYDGWRQLYFVYPSFALLIIFSLSKLPKKVLITGGALTTVYMLGVMVFYFPFQQVYFNEFTSFREREYIRKNFDMDYWGASYYQSLKYILENDTSEFVDVFVHFTPGYENRMMFPPEQRDRIRYVPWDEATYFITNYRLHPESYHEFESFHAIRVGRNTINETFKLK